MVTHPPLTDVLPGDPISSESWNNVLEAIRRLVLEANQRAGTVTVKVLGPGGNPFRSATVTAQPQGTPPRPARAGIFVGATVQAYQFDQVLPGTYQITVEADGFTAKPKTTNTVTVPDDADPAAITFDLLATTSPLSQVPPLLGERLDAALAMIKAPLHAARVIDSHGVVIAPTAIPAGAESFPVLGQFPVPGALVPAGTGIHVNVAALSEVLKRVQMPELRGLTVSAATAAIEAAGLKLGQITTVGGSGPSDK